MGIGVWELALIFLIVLVIFGTKRLRNMGSDLGGAIRSFRTAMSDSEDKGDSGRSIDSEATPDNKEGKEKS
jgi:sec-independent protein translocase protein TatA